MSREKVSLACVNSLSLGHGRFLPRLHVSRNDLARLRKFAKFRAWPVSPLLRKFAKFRAWPVSPLTMKVEEEPNTLVCELPDVRDYGEGDQPIEVRLTSSGRLTVVVYNQGGHDFTEIDLSDLLETCAKRNLNRPGGG
jgi:hypothetical protein